MKVKDLKEHLGEYPDDWDIEFNGLTYCRLKKRGETLVNMEFNEQIRFVDGFCDKCDKRSQELRCGSPAGWLCPICYKHDYENYLKNRSLNG